MRGITPCLWFDDNAEEAARFYTAIFKNSRVLSVARYGEAGAGAAGRPEGSVMTVLFALQGQVFLALNGGPIFNLSPAISFVVNCETQKEVDHFWKKLGAGGEALECGWLRDKFGVSWQIVPTALGEMLQDKDAARAERVMKAMLRMKKIEIAGLKRAYELA